MTDLSQGARDFLTRVIETATATEPLWLSDDEDPGPMLECRRAGLVRSDVYAVMPTPKGRALAATWNAKKKPRAG